MENGFRRSNNTIHYLNISILKPIRRSPCIVLWCRTSVSYNSITVRWISQLGHPHVLFIVIPRLTLQINSIHQNSSLQVLTLASKDDLKVTIKHTGWNNWHASKVVLHFDDNTIATCHGSGSNGHFVMDDEHDQNLELICNEWSTIETNFSLSNCIWRLNCI